MIRTVIRANEVFDRRALQKALGLNEYTIAREVRLGRLKAYRRARRMYFIGADVLGWLKSPPTPEEQETD